MTTRNPRKLTYSRLVDTASGYAIFLVSPGGVVENWPDSAAALYAYDADEVVGERFDYLWADSGESVDADTSLDDLLAEAFDRDVTTEQWHRRGDGSVFWATTTLAPVVNGDHHGFTVVSYDSTSRKQYERMLERQNDRLKEFTDILSHDLQSPLSVVTNRLELYRRTGEDDHLEAIDDTVDRMHNLVEDLLRVARQGNVVRDPEPTDLESVIETARPGAVPSGAAIEYRTVPELMADEDRLVQLFENLFRNAAEHGGDNVTIRVGPLEDGFYVADDGPGVPAEIRPDVFDHGFTTRDGGQGFGLSVVRTIANAHGWDVAVTDGDLGGARFQFTGVKHMVDR